ncbi:fimbrial biogenesis chaperone [Vibrio owensii]|uniref:fimbrial biogenesis chaperone n=1 Tax=Vibrio owensii TaxID=696485 RepID=UPI00221F3BDF|nr:molecular chaperone [Vibrio owensii]
MNFKKIIFGTFVSIVAFHSMAEGFSIDTTRVIFRETDNIAHFSVSNSTENSDYLVQSWVDNRGVNDDKKDQKEPSFIITPPIVKSNSKSRNTLKVIKVNDDLAKDRESVYWIDVKSIPRIKETRSGNSLNIAVKSRIKLFYRPSMVTEQYPDGNNANDSLRFSVKNNELVIDNPSPFYVSFYKLKLNQKDVDIGYQMVEPYSTKKINNRKIKPGTKLSWSTINDFGAVSKTKTQIL